MCGQAMSVLTNFLQSKQACSCKNSSSSSLHARAGHPSIAPSACIIGACVESGVLHSVPLTVPVIGCRVPTINDHNVLAHSVAGHHIR